MDDTINWNRQALRRILAALVAMAGLVPGQATMNRRLRNAVMQILRPAESAVRRLVAVMAVGIEVTLPAQHPKKPKIVTRRRRHFMPMMPPERVTKPLPTRICLPLFDRMRPRHRKRHLRFAPRIGFGPREPDRLPPTPRDQLDPTRVTLRLDALGRVLDDLPREALRLAHWRARQMRAREQGIGGRAPFRSPVRFGRPPGALARFRHEVQDVLKRVHGMACKALEQPDTS